MNDPDFPHCCALDLDLSDALNIIPNIEKVVGITLHVAYNTPSTLTVDYYDQEELRIFTLDEDFKWQLMQALELKGMISATLRMNATEITTIQIEREMRYGQMEKITNLLRKQTPKEL